MKENIEMRFTLGFYDEYKFLKLYQGFTCSNGLINLYDSGKLLEIVKICVKHKPENLNKLNQLITHPNSGGLNGLLKFVRKNMK